MPRAMRRELKMESLNDKNDGTSCVTGLKREGSSRAGFLFLECFAVW
jgi:hypothetical protein